jgi:hypothetical protein
VSKLIRTPTGEEFDVFDVTESKFRARNIPLGFDITTRFTLDGKPIRVAHHRFDRMDVSTFHYYDDSSAKTAAAAPGSSSRFLQSIRLG